MIAFKESSLVLTDGAIESPDDYPAYAAVAKQFDFPMQLGAPNLEAVAYVREAAASSGARIILAGVIEPSSTDPGQLAAAFDSSGVDLLYAAAFPTIGELHNVARAMGATKLPFVVAPMLQADGKMIDGTSLGSAIAHLDGDAAARPWHYMLDCLTPAQARTALESLFRSFPALAHRVVGLKANGSPLSPEDFARDLWDCARTFGLNVLGGARGTDARYIEAIAKSYEEPGESE